MLKSIVSEMQYLKNTIFFSKIFNRQFFFVQSTVPIISFPIKILENAHIFNVFTCIYRIVKDYFFLHFSRLFNYIILQGFFFFYKRMNYILFLTQINRTAYKVHIQFVYLPLWSCWKIFSVCDIPIYIHKCSL